MSAEVAGQAFVVRVAHDNPAMAAEVARALRLLVRSIATGPDVRNATVTATEVEPATWEETAEHPAPRRPMEPGQSLPIGLVLPPPAKLPGR